MTAENGTARNLKDRGGKGSLESEQTGTQTFKDTPRKEASKSVSDTAHTVTTQADDGDAATPAARRSKGSQFIAKLLQVLVLCVGPSSRSHPVDLDGGTPTAVAAH